MVKTLQSKMSPKFRLAGLILMSAWLASCAAPQPAPSEEGVQVTNLSPDQVRESGVTGSLVRWGGTIAGVSNLADGSTAIELVSRPLHNGGRPIHNDRTAGRFIAETPDFLDPEIIKVGRDFTLIGTVTEIREGKVGEADYQFPVVAVDNYRYWSQQRAASQRQYRYWNGHSRHHLDPFFNDWPFWAHDRHPPRRSGGSASFLFILR